MNLRQIHAGVLLVPLLAMACSTVPAPRQESGNRTGVSTDAELQQAAVTSLGDREGAILLIDPRTGRLRGVVNPRLAFEQVYPPGSTIKPFTSLVALRSSAAAGETRHRCSGGFRRPGYEVMCSHPKTASALDLRMALAYSCNDFFGTIGERISESAFLATLRAFGFGTRSGVNAGAEAAGSLPGGEWQTSSVLGEGDGLLVTPIQLITAYSALVNGGKLYRPQISDESEFKPELRAGLTVPAAHRLLVFNGMRDAVSFGTVSHAGFERLSHRVFGKTGTSTSSNGFRTQGWFIGFIDEAQPRLGVLVFLKRAHGAEGAAIARPIFEVFLNQKRDEAVVADAVVAEAVKVHLVTENRTATLPLDQYLGGVIAVEASTESEAEALKALAVVSRSFARKNRGRHRDEGYDFCSTTHCQRFADGPIRNDVQEAVLETTDEVLTDGSGSAVESYFHAACGGRTADIEAVWGGAPQTHLRGIQDDYCVGGSNHRWVDQIPAAKLLEAFRTDARSDVGRRLVNLVVRSYDRSGRVESIAIEGERRQILRGWDFKLIVGRALGWHFLKSSRFDVAREGAKFVFRGNGFGHGLGLCQAGTHVAARRGLSYREVLKHYFEGAGVERVVPGTKTQSEAVFPASFQSAASETMSTEHFLLRMPARQPRADAELILSTLETVRANVAAQLREAGIRLPENRPLEVIVHNTTESFILDTGQPGWVAGATSGWMIALQPIEVLRRRSTLVKTLRHEYVHAVIEKLGRGSSPRWLSEGLAIQIAGEGRIYEGIAAQPSMSVAELERRLSKPSNPKEMRILYAEAYRRVQELVRKEGESAVWLKIENGRRSA